MLWLVQPPPDAEVAPWSIKMLKIGVSLPDCRFWGDVGDIELKDGAEGHGFADLGEFIDVHGRAVEDHAE